MRKNLLIGIASYPADGTTFEELVQHAGGDVRVYLNGANGKKENSLRSGDVVVDIEQRVKIEKDSQWLNRITSQSPQARAMYRPVKRAIDLVLACLAMVVFLPVMIVVAVAIYVDDPGPVFYMQERTGYGGRRFKMYKFRSMVVNAKPMAAQKITTEDGTTRWVWPDKVDKDTRITRVGRFIRKASLDEIPQLLNVINGDMSIVGPRPTSWDLDMYTLHQTERLTVRPGITGLWQISARETKNFDERLLWDLLYVEKLSLYVDFQIILRTILQVLNKKGV